MGARPGARALRRRATTPPASTPAPNPLVRDAHHRNPGLRLGRTDIVFDTLASAIIEQKVTGLQAFGAWRSLVSWFGERAPGPDAAADVRAARPSTAGGASRRGRGTARASSRRSPARSSRPPAGATRSRAWRRPRPTGPSRDAVLTSLRGVGSWTSAETRIRAFGDPDAVSVGDYHLAHEIGYALTGHRVDDDGMLELLAPWAGHRQRVIRLLGASGPREPRRGPRLSPEDHRDR